MVCSIETVYEDERGGAGRRDRGGDESWKPIDVVLLSVLHTRAPGMSCGDCVIMCRGEKMNFFKSVVNNL
jgi:hypothetical protein